MLLNAGADKKIKCNNGKKAFDYAKENEFINSTEVYHLLKDTDTPQTVSYTHLDVYKRQEIRS